ncbi:MAG: pantoate--beta-alanine ligase [Kofleriaceae bacterium]|nr:pantoate--beta-alanine ligase [Kofleriaceae bacterium]MBP6840710.1 pantoate--beta-alanine ligase [Kofleriaceae bacterium]MBP9205696.1 pantoate--beta-alanine ligase [Kofleriaceae bacterium]
MPFEVIRDPAAMRARCEDLRRDGLRLAVVPTMGALHEGHLTLLRAARAAADVVVLTIFVNPTQFGPSEDLSRYPRDEAGDLAKARTCGLDLAFCPDAAAMYPAGSQTFVEVRALAQPLCGASRPGHFAGVATIVSKLLNLTRPHVAFFGEKDYQQLAVIRRMVRDLDLGVDIVGVPIVREADGLALSSRNAYLSPAQREQALALSRALAAGRACFAGGERRADAVVAAARAILDATPEVRLDYLELRDAAELTELSTVTGPALLAVAAFVGTTRLIDNTVLTP